MANGGRKRAVPVSHYFLLNLNFVIRMMILSDVLWMGAVGLLGPIFAIFIVDFVEGGNAVVAGTAAAIYLVTKSSMQIPVATIIDRVRGERDDFWILFIGAILGASIPLLYLLVSLPIHLYLVQFISGIVMSVTFPSHMAIFTRHTDKHKEATAWGVYYTLNDFSAAIAASLGGLLAQTVGFQVLIVLVVCLSLCGVSLLWWIKPYLQFVPEKSKRKTRKPIRGRSRLASRK